MRLLGPIAASTLLLAACESRENGMALTPENESEAPPPRESEAPAAPAKADQVAGVARWDLQSSGEGVALVLLAEPKRATIRLFCPSGGKRLLVNVPAFRPIGSEERLSFGSGGEAVALVADTGGDRQRGGVSGAAEVPANLAALVASPVSASYGAQGSGPHPAPPPALSRAFVAACNEVAAADRRPTVRASASASPCLMQGGERLRMTPLRAVGTEPFWGARIEGRCVTYSHPEDQKGSRIWTSYAPGPDGGIWVGALGGQRFELRTRAHPGCSDGMSDRLYPFAVELLVQGEQRRGCAEPL